MHGSLIKGTILALKRCQKESSCFHINCDNMLSVFLLLYKIPKDSSYIFLKPSSYLERWLLCHPHLQSPCVLRGDERNILIKGEMGAYTYDNRTNTQQKYIFWKSSQTKDLCPDNLHWIHQTPHSKWSWGCSVQWLTINACNVLTMYSTLNFLFSLVSSEWHYIN